MSDAELKSHRQCKMEMNTRSCNRLHRKAACRAAGCVKLQILVTNVRQWLTHRPELEGSP